MFYEKVNRDYVPVFEGSIAGGFVVESPFFVVSGEVPMVMVAYVWGRREGLSVWVVACTPMTIY